MNAQTFLAANVANVIYEDGRRCEWWPFESRAAFDDFLQSRPIRLRGAGTHLIVGLDKNREIVVRELESITDAGDVTQDAFIVSYAQLTERVIHEYVS